MQALNAIYRDCDGYCVVASVYIDDDGDLVTRSGELLEPTGDRCKILGWGALDGLHSEYRTEAGAGCYIVDRKDG